MSERVELDEFMVINAVRYALGRATYIVPLTVTETLRVWPQLSRTTRANIIHDVRKALSEDKAGWEMDRKAWARLLTAEVSNV